MLLLLACVAFGGDLDTTEAVVPAVERPQLALGVGYGGPISGLQARFMLPSGLEFDASLGGGVGWGGGRVGGGVTASLGASYTLGAWSVGGIGTFGPRLGAGLWVVGATHGMPESWNRSVGWYAQAALHWHPKEDGRMSLYAGLVFSQPVPQGPMAVVPSVGVHWVLGGPRNR